MNVLDFSKDKGCWEEVLPSQTVPDIALYMDQILSLIEGKGVTKTMINNYSKERLLKPVKGKKYSKEQIIQILCILNLKQSLSMQNIKRLMPQEEGVVDYCKVYDVWAGENQRLAAEMKAFVKEQIVVDGDLSHEEQLLAVAMMLSSCCGYFMRLCEALDEEEK